MQYHTHSATIPFPKSTQPFPLAKKGLRSLSSVSKRRAEGRCLFTPADQFSRSASTIPNVPAFLEFIIAIGISAERDRQLRASAAGARCTFDTDEWRSAAVQRSFKLGGHDSLSSSCRFQQSWTPSATSLIFPAIRRRTANTHTICARICRSKDFFGLQKIFPLRSPHANVRASQQPIAPQRPRRAAAGDCRSDSGRNARICGIPLCGYDGGGALCPSEFTSLSRMTAAGEAPSNRYAADGAVPHVWVRAGGRPARWHLPGVRLSHCRARGSRENH
jgi:hypothetical protein